LFLKVRALFLLLKKTFAVLNFKIICRIHEKFEFETNYFKKFTLISILLLLLLLLVVVVVVVVFVGVVIVGLVEYTTLSMYLSQYLTNLMHNICFTISFISCHYMFRAHVLIIRRSKLH